MSEKEEAHSDPKVSKRRPEDEAEETARTKIRKALPTEIRKALQSYLERMTRPELDQVEKKIPFPMVEADEVSNLLYVYMPQSSSSRCPREDVITHMEKVLGATLTEDEHERYYKLDEANLVCGSTSGYDKARGCHRSNLATMGYHYCESKGCQDKPMRSSNKDFRLKDAAGKPMPFATNSLAIHYLVEHWDDVAKDKGHMERLNQYLEAVGINPIVTDA